MVAALAVPKAASADCYTLTGAQFSRWVIATDGGTSPVHRDGAVMLTAGYACGVLNGSTFSLDAGASAGSILDTKTPGGSATLGIVLAVDYSDVLSVGLVPHWVTSESPRYLESYGVGLSITTRFANVLDAIGLDFANGVQAGINETEPRQ
jgi:hypothetical protein